jgi:ribosome-binding protein aMBF1 (putative translation factor)
VGEKQVKSYLFTCDNCTKKKTPTKRKYIATTKTTPEKTPKKDKNDTPSKTKREQQTDLLYAWLDERGLIEYYNLFIEQGYDSFNYLHKYGLQEDDLAAIGVTKPGHKKQLQTIKGASLDFDSC